MINLKLDITEKGTSWTINPKQQTTKKKIRIP